MAQLSVKERQRLAGAIEKNKSIREKVRTETIENRISLCVAAKNYAESQSVLEQLDNIIANMEKRVNPEKE